LKAIDFHTHAFPDFLAERAIAQLEAHAHGHKAFIEGTVSALLRSMDEAEIEKSVVCSIATSPSQVDSIVKWSAEIASDRIIPFPSVHPNTENVKQKLREIYHRGFLGVKLHPQYQGFCLDDDSAYGIYEGVEDLGLILVAHCGFDLAFPDDLSASPERISRVLDRFPSLVFVATHSGSWKMWDDVRKYLVGRDLFFETSFSIEDGTPETIRRILIDHGTERVLFGSDSPWKKQANEMRLIKSLNLGQEAERAIFRENAERLLAAPPA